MNARKAPDHAIARAAEPGSPSAVTEPGVADAVTEQVAAEAIAAARSAARAGANELAEAVWEPTPEPSPARVGANDLVEAVWEPTPEPVVAEPVVAEPVVVTRPVDARDLVPLDDIAPAIVAASMSRRAFVGFGLALVGGLAGAAGLARLFPVFEDASSPISPIVPAYDPATRAWTFVVDTSACIGCGLCVAACKEENDVPEEAAFTRTWVERHVVTADGARYVDSPEAGLHGFPPESTAPGAEGKAVEASWFMPRLCMQCENSPCTSVCPVGATYRTADGVVLVDSRRCIGCGYCVVACPYGARYLTPAGDRAPNDAPGVADKCNWCYHRISRGRQPACVEVCPVGARRFGDAAEPDGEIAALVREHDPQALYPEYGTRPRVLYLGPSVEEA